MLPQELRLSVSRLDVVLPLVFPPLVLLSPAVARLRFRSAQSSLPHTLPGWLGQLRSGLSLPLRPPPKLSREARAVLLRRSPLTRLLQPAVSPVTVFLASTY